MIDMYAYITHLPNINHISIYGIAERLHAASQLPRPCPSSERHGGSGCKAARSVRRSGKCRAGTGGPRGPRGV